MPVTRLAAWRKLMESAIARMLAKRSGRRRGERVGEPVDHAVDLFVGKIHGARLLQLRLSGKPSGAAAAGSPEAFEELGRDDPERAVADVYTAACQRAGPSISCNAGCC